MQWKERLVWNVFCPQIPRHLKKCRKTNWVEEHNNKYNEMNGQWLQFEHWFQIYNRITIKDCNYVLFDKKCV